LFTLNQICCDENKLQRNESERRKETRKRDGDKETGKMKER
jgi:hypothetical protein